MNNLPAQILFREFCIVTLQNVFPASYESAVKRARAVFNYQGTYAHLSVKYLSRDVIPNISLLVKRYREKYKIFPRIRDVYKTGRKFFNGKLKYH